MDLGSLHLPCRTSTQGGALLPGAGSRSFRKRVTDRVCLLKNALWVPNPSPWSTCVDTDRPTNHQACMVVSMHWKPKHKLVPASEAIR
jgi:hypothetical protein